MKNFFIRWIVNIIALVAVVHLDSDIYLADWTTTMVAALLLGIVNALFKPILLVLTLPINILTLGLFTLFINAFLFFLVASLVHGFSVDGFWGAFWGSIVFSIVSLLLNLFIGPLKQES